MAVCNYAKTLAFDRILATKSENQIYQSIEILKHRQVLRFDTLIIDITKIEALYHLFRKTADNTAGWRHSSIGKTTYLLY